MDRLDVCRVAEEKGGTERREALEKIVIYAHELGCDTRVGGGRAGGLNIRYGSIGYAVMDINTKGVVKLYAKPHPNKDAPDELNESINDFVDDAKKLELKSSPINSYGHLEDKIEDIPIKQLKGFVEQSVELIREEYYEPHLDGEFLGLTSQMIT